MGGKISKLVNYLYGFSEFQGKVLMLGLNGGGKTTILYQMKLKEATYPDHTVGFNVETIKHENIDFTVWDMGGGCKIRQLWHHYFQGTNAVIFIFDISDISDKERVKQNKSVLKLVMNQKALNDSPILIMANKMDCSDLQPVEVSNMLGLHEFKGQWHVELTCGLNGTGITEGFSWLAKTLKNKRAK